MGRPGFANLQSQKATLESPNPGPLRPQQTLESWGHLVKYRFLGPAIPRPHFSKMWRSPGICIFICFHMCLWGTPRFWNCWQSHLLEDVYNFQKTYLNLYNCLLSPKLIKSQWGNWKKKQVFQILVFIYETMIEVFPNLTTIPTMYMNTNNELWSWKKVF